MNHAPCGRCPICAPKRSADARAAGLKRAYAEERTGANPRARLGMVTSDEVRAKLSVAALRRVERERPLVEARRAAKRAARAAAWALKQAQISERAAARRIERQKLREEARLLRELAREAKRKRWSAEEMSTQREYRHAMWTLFKETDRYSWPLECVYCGKLATTLDHIIPRTQGGAVLDVENLVPACRTCNSSKGALTPDEWLDAGLYGRRSGRRRA